jgi:hypothetical protein
LELQADVGKEATVTGVLSCAVEVAESSQMPVGVHRNSDGKAVACVDIVSPVVSLYGSAAAMRRLARAAARAADEADRLTLTPPATARRVFRRPLAFAEDAGELPCA